MGPSLAALGKRSTRPAPVDWVEGLGGNKLKVEGLWVFHGENVYGQRLSVDALVVAGCGEEMLLGTDFVHQHQATINSATREVRWGQGEETIVLPFD